MTRTQYLGLLLAVVAASVAGNRVLDVMLYGDVLKLPRKNFEAFMRAQTDVARAQGYELADDTA